MIGARLEQSRSNDVCVVALLLVAGLLAAFFFAQYDKAWLVAAILPALLALAFWLSSPRPFRATVLPTGLQLHDTDETVAWNEIEAIACESGGRRRFPITLQISGRRIHLPAKLNVGSFELYQFLLEVVHPPEPSPSDSQLAEFYKRQRERFGADRVWHAAGRGHSPPGRSVGLAILLAGLAGTLIYVAYGVSARRDPLVIAGGFGILITVIGALAMLVVASQRQRIRSQRSFGVIVAPTGLALSQNEIKGELRWDELRDVRMRGRGRFGLTAGGIAPGIELHVPGAVIKILDLYDQPLAAIHERIVQNWRGPA